MSFFWLCIVASFLSFLGIISDASFISENQMIYYVIGRIIFGIFSLALLILNNFTHIKLNRLVELQLLNMGLYGIHGQWFVPCYYLGYLESLFVIGLFYPIREKILKIFIILGGIVMSLTIINSPAKYSTDLIMITKFHYDSIAAIIIISFATYVGHKYITKKRLEKDVLFEKFIDLGKNSSFIIHDFKGMMMSPIIYIDQLNAEFTKTDPNNEKIEKYIKKLKEELHAIREYSIETTNLTLPSNTQDNEKVFIKDIVRSLQTLFYKQLDGIQINYNEEDFIIYSPSKLKKILHNIILNSIEVLRDNRIKNPTITLSVEDHILSVYDNGVGFDEKILKNINKKNGNFITSKKNGSGLGLSVVKELLSKDDIKYHFSNHENNGAKISINFTHQKENL